MNLLSQLQLIQLILITGIVSLIISLGFLTVHIFVRRERNRTILIRTIIDTLPQAIVLKDTKSRYVACNRVFARSLGKDIKNLLGTTDADHYSADLAKQYRDDELEVMASGKTTEACELYEEDQKRIWGEFIRSPVFDAESKVSGVLVIFRDSTEKREAELSLQERERRYRMLSEELEVRIEQSTQELNEAKRDMDLFFEVSVEYLCLLDMSGHFLKINSFWNREMGWREDELAAKSVLDFIHAEDRERVLEAARVLSKGGVLVDFQCRFRKADGSWIWLSWASIGVRDRGLIMAAAHDITSQRETEDRLRLAREEAERASRSKTQFIATMSHELRTPLNAVLGYAALLEGIVEDEKGRKYLKSIGSSGRALLAIINDILDLTRAESGRIELTPQPFNPRSILQELSEIFRFSAEEKHLSLQFQASERLPQTVLLDPARLRQVLINLVGNAIKFTEQGTVSVYMDSVDEDRSVAANDFRSSWKATIKIEVIDTGIGISEEYRARLFEPFSQQDAGISHRYGGTGLGLAIAKRLLDLMGGSIRCDEGPGGGTRFRIELPSVRVAGSSVASSADTIPPAIDGASMASRWMSEGTELEKKSRILVVERGDSIFSEVTRVLAGTPVELLVASAAEQALSLSSSVDLVLVHGDPGDIKGTELCRMLKGNADTKNIPIILIGEKALQDNLVDGFNSGATDYVHEPLDPEELRARIKNQLDLKRARDELALVNADLSAATRIIEKKNSKLESLVTRLDRLSMTDELTSLPNRRSITSRLYKEIARSARALSPLSILIGDLDRFKLVNDNIGHQAGDATLAECARRFAESLREGDVVGRWGGEEFLAVLPDTELPAALQAAERVRAHQADSPIIYGTDSIVVTFSLGAASLVPNMNTDPELVATALIRSADDALYRAKAKGRNRVEGIRAKNPLALPKLPNEES
ncbi:PAS domain-containing hybrid sensor histidine kinase/response regulator [Treponema sp.]